MTALAEHRSSRERLIAATLAVLDEQGYGAMRVDDVARRAGLTTGAIYGTFRAKHALVTAALLARHPEAVHAAVAVPRPAIPAGVLDAALATLDARGYRKVRMADVSRRAGVPTTQLAKIFPTKHHLLVAAIAATAPADFAEAAAEASGGDTGGRRRTGPVDMMTRDRLLEAALEALDRDGYRGARIVDIARRAGMTTGAVYANFDSKHALLDAALAKRYGDRFRSLLEAAPARRGGLGSTMAAALRGDALIEQRALVELFAAASRSADAGGPLAAVLDHRRRDIAAVIDRAKAEGRLRADVPTDGLAHVVQLLALGNIVARAVGASSASDEEIRSTVTCLASSLDPDAGRFP